MYSLSSAFEYSSMGKGLNELLVRGVGGFCRDLLLAGCLVELEASPSSSDAIISLAISSAMWPGCRPRRPRQSISWKPSVFPSVTSGLNDRTHLLMQHSIA